MDIKQRNFALAAVVLIVFCGAILIGLMRRPSSADKQALEQLQAQNQQLAAERDEAIRRLAAASIPSPSVPVNTVSPTAPTSSPPTIRPLTGFPAFEASLPPSPSPSATGNTVSPPSPTPPVTDPSPRTTPRTVSASDLSASDAQLAFRVFRQETVEFDYPASWTVTTGDTTGYRSWKLVNSGQTILEVRCFIGSLDFSGRDYSQQERSFQRNAILHKARLLIGSPQTGSNLPWNVMIQVAKEGNYPAGCGIIFNNQSPPTASERSLAQRIYESLR